MQDLHEVINQLEQTMDDGLVAKAAEILASPINWLSVIYKHLQAMDDKKFCEQYVAACAHDTSPEIFLLYDDPNHRFRINLNYFDKVAHNNLFKQKKITPHMHHFPFATRILHGKYLHWLYKNSGSMNQPILSTALQTTCEKEDVYILPYDVFHVVLAPAEETMSLMIRGKATLTPKHLRLPLDTTKVLKRKNVILEKLHSASTQSIPAKGNLVNILL